MAKTPRDGAVRLAEGADALEGTNSTSAASSISAAVSGTTSSGEHSKLDPVRCPHCGEPHPPTYSHCPRTGKPLQTGPALVGRVIAGRYRVTGILGEGGMGAVYIAEHLLLGRKVAIKRLHPELTGDEKAVARFQREARAAAATGHEHIVEVLDLGYAEDGAPYLVMEYLRGSALAQILKQEGRLALPRTANIIGQVLAALSAVHQREIVHRDLKPDNVFLTRRGGVGDYVKVLDFGISKMKQDEGEPTNLTRTGVTMGTPYYMSPEQARGIRKLDHRVDLYAVAVIMYECLTGRLPLMGDNYHALLQQILRVEPIPPSAIVPTLPASLDGPILKGLAKDPGQRYGSAAEMIEALAPFGVRVGDVTAMIATQPISAARLEPALEASRVDARAPTEAVGGGASTSSGEASRAAPEGSRPDHPAVTAPPPVHAPLALAPPTRDTTRRSEVARSRPSAATPPLASAAPPIAPPQLATPTSTDVRATRARQSPPSPKPSTATGPRYFFAASEDWAHERSGRTSAALASAPQTGSTPLHVGSSATPTPASIPPSAASSGVHATSVGAAQPSALARAVASAERSSTELAREAARAPRDDANGGRDASVKGALVVALLDHLELELGNSGLALALGTVDVALRRKLEGVILPMAWLPLGLFDALLAAADRDHGEATRAAAAGRAAAERELSTTHRLFLQTATPSSVLDRLPHLHRVYFSRGEARVSPVTNPATSHGTRIEVEGIGPESQSLVAWLSGFWQRMLELAGARDVKVVGITSRARGDERSSVTIRWR
jgi:serine/threonine protein kinase